MEKMKNKIYSISIHHWEKPIQGIVIDSSKDWILLRNLYDYRIDGLSLVNRKHIDRIERTEREEFAEKVLIANYRFSNEVNDVIPLETKTLFEYLECNNIVFQISFEDDSYTYIGKVENVSSLKFSFKKIGSRGIWLAEEQQIEIESIYTIEFNTDYINSLLTYSKTLID